MKTNQKKMMELGFSRADARAILHAAERYGRDLRRGLGGWPDANPPGFVVRIRRERKAMGARHE